LRVAGAIKDSIDRRRPFAYSNSIHIPERHGRGFFAMRWSIIRLICTRELRDQLRDRRTIFMIAVLPVLLYPVLGAALLQFAGFSEKPSVIGVIGREHLPELKATSFGYCPPSITAWFSVTPASAIGPQGGVCAAIGADAVFRLAQSRIDYPPLLIDGRIPSSFFEMPHEALLVRIEALADDDRTPLENKQVDLILTVPPSFASDLERNGRPVLSLAYRENDDSSRQAAKRLYDVLGKWKRQLGEVRLLKQGLPENYDDAFAVKDPERAKPTEELAKEGLLDMLVRLFPFLLVMWSLAGALYPAVDLCAGEKERGTMETLLISPASREEIVWGKFLTIWIFSAATALLNLASMGITTWHFSSMLTNDVLRPVAIMWCVLLALPLSALFSAVCLAVGAYARSSKEGQYYLMPLFLLTMPLIFLTLAPGVELNPFYSLVPVTGVALLMQRLMTVSLDKVPWLYFIPVLAPIALYSWLALRWAIEQFKREEVLFREAERLDIGLWLRRLFRDKETLPTAGQAFFCFALILFLRWSFLSAVSRAPLVVSTSIVYLAFVTAPPLFMALLLTTRPMRGLALRIPRLGDVMAAGLLACLILPPLSDLTLIVLRQFPLLKELLDQRQPMIEELRSISEGELGTWWQYILVYALLAAMCEEIAFRGFILTGLRQRFSAWTAILISSLLFALYHMNVFQALPAFVLGVVLAILTVRSESILPSMLLHFLNNGAVIGIALLPRAESPEATGLQMVLHPFVTVPFTLAAMALLVVLGRGVNAARVKK
jgi:sodium transport system permease protein